MSICIEQNYQNNFSQSLSTCESESQFSVYQLTKQLNLWMSRSRQRKQLAGLDNRMLEDIGLTQEQVLKEINKPFWK